jgi:septal ring factor EnvC (AmiA/AmiB activator)
MAAFQARVDVARAEALAKRKKERMERRKAEAEASRKEEAAREGRKVGREAPYVDEKSGVGGSYEILLTLV